MVFRVYFSSRVSLPVSYGEGGPRIRMMVTICITFMALGPLFVQGTLFLHYIQTEKFSQVRSSKDSRAGP